MYQQLGEKLGVTGSSYLKMESMSDISLLKPLCEELGITFNELLSGEQLDNDVYQKNVKKIL